MKPKSKKVTKSSVDYRTGTTKRHCGNCVMYRARTHACDLVLGMIRPDAVCDRWQAK